MEKMIVGHVALVGLAAFLAVVICARLVGGDFSDLQFLLVWGLFTGFGLGCRWVPKIFR